MSKIYAEIKRIVEDISIRVNQNDVILEAITNAIQANATKIDCYFDLNENPIDFEEFDNNKRKVDKIIIQDNGDGMNDNNYNSFINYRSDYKAELGCKGIGRFLFLKVYEYAKFKSNLKREKEERFIKFDIDYDTDHLIKKPKEFDENSTEVIFDVLSKNYLNHEKNIDRRIEFNLKSIKEKVLLHLIPTLYFYKNKGVEITISFNDVTKKIGSEEITSSDIPFFLNKPFSIKDYEGTIFNFNLNYFIGKNAGPLNAFYCANNRTVCKFEDNDFKLNLPYNYSGYFLLESKYLDERLNSERNDFYIYPVKTNLYSTISWDIINENLKKVITELVKDGIPETQTINKEKIREIFEERPYLINYINENDIELAGFLDKKKLIDNAKKKFDVMKENILINSRKIEYSDKDLNDAIELAQNELVSYVNDRVMIIENLNKLLNDKEKVESKIHNLFMQKQTQDKYFEVGKNNLWLLDDRYTTYSYAASDTRINEVLKEIGEDSNNIDIPTDKPDLSLFFSHNPENPERLKSVLIEIKPFDFTSKPDRKKHAGIQQLVDYVKAFKIKENIEEISAYLLTDIDDKLASRLKGDDYIPLFSLDTPIFYRFFKELEISIYVISASTIIKDAYARNKIFLDIIKKQSRIYGILNNE